MNNNADIPELKPASFSSRFVAFIIDGTIILTAWIVIGKVLPPYLGDMWDDQKAACIGFAAMLFAVLYFIFFHAAMGRSLGMSTTLITIADQSGRRAGMARFMIRLLPWWICAAGFLLSWKIVDHLRHEVVMAAGWVVYAPFVQEPQLGPAHRIAKLLVLLPAVVFVLQTVSLLATRGRYALSDKISGTVLIGGDR